MEIAMHLDQAHWWIRHLEYCSCWAM